MPFNFNLYSGLLFPAFIQGLLVAILLFIRGYREERLSDKLLGCLLLLSTLKLSLWMLGFLGWYDSHDVYSTIMFYFPFENLIWMGPILYFYFLSLTNEEFKLSRTHLKHFIVPAIFLILEIGKFLMDIFFYYPFPTNPASHFGTKGPWADLLRNHIFESIAYLSFFYYLYITIKAYRNYQGYVRQNFSSTAFIEFAWIRNILYAVGLGMIVFLAFEIGSLITGSSGYVYYWYPYLALGIIIYYISLAGYQSGNRNFQLKFKPALTEVVDVQENHPLPVDQEMKALLTSHMFNAKPHLEPELSLADLSLQLHMNASTLSKLINDGFGQNFNDFINEYRVNEVIEKLKKGEHKRHTLLSIAYDSGFNSKATFNRAFKKIKSMSPKDWVLQEASSNN